MSKNPAGVKETLSAINEFDKGLGLSLGFEKGGILAKVIADVMHALSEPNEPIHILEMGSHLGDGTLHMVDALGSKSASLTAIEPSIDSHSIGSRIVREALKKDAGQKVKYNPAKMPFDFDDFLHSTSDTHEIPHFHVVVMDHGDHTTFSDDLQSLLMSGMLAPGAKIVADNAYTKRLEKQDYFDFINANENLFDSEVIDVTKPYRDQVHVATYKVSHDEL